MSDQKMIDVLNRISAYNLEHGIVDVEINKDSINSCGERITTFLINRLPKGAVQAEFNTHRTLCLHGDSMISFSEYDFSIESLYEMQENGDDLSQYELVQLNESTDRIQYTTIKKVIKNDVQELYSIVVSSDVCLYKLTLTENHKIYSGNGNYFTLSDYDLTNEIETIPPIYITPAIADCGDAPILAKVVYVKYFGTSVTYDIEVNGEYPNFFANSICVHNSRNSASSRAINKQRYVDMIRKDPYIPIWTYNKKGMVGEVIEDQELVYKYTHHYLQTMEYNLKDVDFYQDCAKQDVNPILDAYARIPVITTSTSWEYFFELRNNYDVKPEFRRIAMLMQDLYNSSTPVKRNSHLPFITEEEENSYKLEELYKLSTARCAWISLCNHIGYGDIETAIRTVDMMYKNKHFSPFDHCAKASPRYTGLYKGWIEYRKFF